MMVNDSDQLAELRFRFHQHPRLREVHCTPGRLGAFAAILGQPIDDYGAHSRRWIEAFKRGRESLTSRSELFNP